MYNLDLFIDIHHVVVIVGLRTAIFIPHCLYSFGEVCGWSSSVFAPAPLVRVSLLPDALFAPSSAAPVVCGAVVCCSRLWPTEEPLAGNHLFAC